MSSVAQILASLGAVKTSRAAVLTSYNVSYRFFEQVVLPRLRGAGCQHVLLLVDAARFAEDAADPERRPQQAGKLYTLVPIHAAGVFHPKILLQVGPSNGRAWIGSHNLTHAGFNHNRELTTYASTRDDDRAQALACQAWQAVRGWLPDSTEAQEAADAVERLAPWLTESFTQGGPELLHGSAERPLWPQLSARLPVRVDRITVVGPFFDNRLELLHTLARDLTPTEIVVGLIPGDAQFPAHHRNALPASTRLVNASPLAPDERRYLHAKAILFEHPDGALLVSGSANPSAPALLGGPHANVEAVVVQRLSGDEDPLDMRSLHGAPPLHDDDWAKLPEEISPEATAPSVLVLLATASGDEILLAQPVDDVHAIHFTGEADQPLGVRAHRGALERLEAPDGFDLEKVRWLELRRDDQPIARVLVHHRRALRRLSRTGAEQRLTEVLRSLETHEPDLASVLALLDPLLDAPVTTRRVSKRASPRERTPATFGSGGADVTPAEPKTEEQYGAEGDLAEVMLYLHHRLGVAVDRVDRSEEELVDSSDEDLVVAPSFKFDMETRERDQSRFDRLILKLGKRLLVPLSELNADHAHERMPLLAAVLGVANATVRRTPSTPRQDHDHLRIAKLESLRKLLLDGVAVVYFRRDLIHAANVVGPDAEELRMIPVLLAWLCCELRIGPPGPPRTLHRDEDVDTDLKERAAWVALIPALDRDHWARLDELVRASDSSPDARSWLKAARASAKHLRAVARTPQRYAKRTGLAQAGDLTAIGNDPSTLRVVEQDLGGRDDKRKVMWLKVGESPNMTLPGGMLLTPAAWGKGWAG